MGVFKITIPPDALARSELEEGEDPDARFLRVRLGKQYGQDVVEYRAQMSRTFDITFEVWINGRVLLSGSAARDTEEWLEFQAAAEGVRVCMLQRIQQIKAHDGGAKAKRDAARIFEW